MTLVTRGVSVRVAARTKREGGRKGSVLDEKILFFKKKGKTRKCARFNKKGSTTEQQGLTCTSLGPPPDHFTNEFFHVVKGGYFLKKNLVDDACKIFENVPFIICCGAVLIQCSMITRRVVGRWMCMFQKSRGLGPFVGGF